MFSAVQRTKSDFVASLLMVTAMIGGPVSLFPGPALANRVNVYTSEYFHDINPLRERTYVSGWISQLVAARLFRRSCISRSAQILMEPECIRDGLQIQEDRISVDGRRQEHGYRCLLPEGSVARDFIRASVRQTVEHINNPKLRRNYYYGNGFRMVGNREYPLLQITTPPNIGQEGLQVLDFPLFTPGSTSAIDKIAPNRSRVLNEMTFGAWKFGVSTNQSLLLELRGDPSNFVSPASAFEAVGATREIQIKSVEQSAMSNLAIRADQEGDAETVRNLGHVFLNIGPAFTRVLGRNYDYAFAPAARGPFYLGFNFSQSGVKGDLFEQEEFRRLLAQTLWNTPVLGDQFSGLIRTDANMYGTWPGQSLLSLQDGSVRRLSSEELRTRIQSFLSRNSSKFIAVNLNVWVSPEGRRMFDNNGVPLLEAALNGLWSCEERLCGERAPGNEVGVFFRFLPPSNEPRLASNKYDIIIDRFIHGERLSRIADAFEPGDPSNLMNMTNKQVPASDLAEWRKETTAAKKDMTRWLKEHYYLIVLGEYRFRDLYLSEMTKPAAGEFCSNGGELIHPSGAHLWRLPR